MNIPITLLPDLKSGGFTVVSPLLNFVTEGDDMEEAIANAQEAVACHIEGLQKDTSSEEKAFLQSIDKSVTTFVTV